MINLLLLLVLAHLIADYILQTKIMAEHKSEMRIKWFLLHGVIVFLVSFLMIFNYGILFALKVSGILFLSHIIIDFIKEGINNIFKLNNGKVVTFFVDQILHLLIIIFVWSSFDGYKGMTVFRINIQEPYKQLFKWFTISIQDFLFLLIFYIAVIFVGAVILDLIMNLVNVEHFKEENTKISRYIGIVERGLILTLVTFGSISSLALILTAKSLARFNKMDKPDFAEYYLLGTLTSMSIALVGGLVLRYLINFTQ